MKAMTIRGIEPEISEKLKHIAKKQGKSINRLVIELLRKECGLEKKCEFTREYTDLDELFGSWSHEEFQYIHQKIDAERQIDEELWK